MKVAERQKARYLRKKGYSINQIVAKTGSSKTSVSIWVRDVVLTKNQQAKISTLGRSVQSIEKRRTNRLKNENIKRRIIIDEAKKDFFEITKQELKLIGTILYLGEGAKSRMGTVAVSNSDPSVIKMMMRFLREVCDVPEEKFRGQIHTFEHANIGKTEEYWSTVTGISQKQFYKTYIKPSSASLQKRKTLPFGTFGISVNDTKLLLKIIGWIEKIKEITVGDSML